MNNSAKAIFSEELNITYLVDQNSKKESLKA
jgi:hypothetical protein